MRQRGSASAYHSQVAQQPCELHPRPDLVGGGVVGQVGRPDPELLGDRTRGIAETASR